MTVPPRRRRAGRRPWRHRSRLPATTWRRTSSTSRRFSRRRISSRPPIRTLNQIKLYQLNNRYNANLDQLSYQYHRIRGAIEEKRNAWRAETLKICLCYAFGVLLWGAFSHITQTCNEGARTPTHNEGAFNSAGWHASGECKQVIRHFTWPPQSGLSRVAARNLQVKHTPVRAPASLLCPVRHGVASPACILCVMNTCLPNLVAAAYASQQKFHKRKPIYDDRCAPTGDLF